MDKMAKIKEYQLPGFYTDERGAYGIILGRYYICCFVCEDDGHYDVTVDTVDEKGDFANNLQWDSFEEPVQAIQTLRQHVRTYSRLY